MLSDNDQQASRRIPSLVQYCQRVASNHVESISSLGDLRYDIVKPVLSGCSPETLVRLEEASPQLEVQTLEIWRQLCFRKYPVQCSDRFAEEEPDSWRDQFFFLEDEQARRLEEVGSRIRSQRQQAEERKKESQIKITDRLPPAKKARWGMASQPRSLFQKTRTEASKLQKTMYGPRLLPPMPAAKSYRVLPSTTTSSLLPAPPSTLSNPRVTVKAVRRPSSSSVPPSSSATPKQPVPPPSTAPPRLLPPSQSPPPPRAETVRPLKSPAHSKKDPMSNLFMPKHRAHSQLPRQSMATPVNGR
ncbi:hypothetical protein GLOTRDRAFT_136780 [Gloeophyllum trabeum ATCC 11539]|uniref:Elongin-A n=1 Tax=Gloeophyllum trabeum (strain ATCC 11539 / FP-39264 / Madison 617) TaxID=670483 RepID=S7QDQ0_GLOTA|nr:uncharacterized protein GLOTRDRAFT_136780 [Gloeophyllum trabeum ATCC 11539]EPQ57966.1 hypothetical protein GLOTRDRAFT_136780 [Gloeophyllum trabeum ATCC 11539]